tara:strand:+ start:468 stop:956 length:489 start_codon:yes stop_codon:yes gene_type:complete
MRYVYIFIFLIIYKNISALDISCTFEEVYQNGDVQQGVFLVKDNKFRYQYNSKNLYTIIYNQDIFFYLENRDTTNFYKIEKNTYVLEVILDIISDHPNFKKNYYLKDGIIKVEYGKKNLIKRIVLTSEKQNLSFYINDCQYNTLKNLYFSYSPFYEYNHKYD